MRAISFHKWLPAEHPVSLVDVTVDEPKPGPRDIRVEVRAISVNPVDTKVRKGGGPGKPSGELKILGWDAAGVVTAVGLDFCGERRSHQVSEVSALFDLAIEIQNLFLSRGWNFCFIGGLVVQHWGEPRVTMDVDLTLLTGFGLYP
jgi:NADPH:quinone reductase-like Zn-dependent oxidoreductase